MKCKVVFFVNSLYGGGAEKVLQTLLRHLDRQRFEITLYSLHREKPDDNYPSDITFRYIYGHGKWSDYLKTFVYQYFSPSLFYRLFVKGMYNTEVAFIEGYSTRIVSGSTNPHSKKIAWVHIDLKNNHWTDVAFRNRKEERFCYKNFQQVIAVSESVKKVNDLLFPNLQSSIYIYNPVPSKEIISKSKEPGMKNFMIDGFTFVTSGRLTKQKGYDRLLEAVARLQKENFHFRVLVIGEGEERYALEQQISHEGLKSIVRLLGYMNNPFPIITKADCFVCSSRAEGFSLVILEAMVLGLPIISTNCSGPNELVGESQYGLLVNNSVDGIYHGMKKILEDSQYVKALRMKSLERSRCFDLELTMEQIEKVLI